MDGERCARGRDDREPSSLPSSSTSAGNCCQARIFPDQSVSTMWLCPLDVPGPLEISYFLVKRHILLTSQLVIPDLNFRELGMWVAMRCQLGASVAKGKRKLSHASWLCEDEVCVECLACCLLGISSL